MAIRVLQWNIWLREDIKNIAMFLCEQNADIICLQELTLSSPYQKISDTPAYIAEQLGYNYYCKELPLESTDGSKMMMANGVFSKYPVIDSRFVWISEQKGAGGYDDEFRAYVEVLLNVKGKKLRVGTTHMSYTHQFQPTPNKRAETKKLVAEIKKSAEPLILAGDFNATPASPTFVAVNKVLQHAGPDIMQPTWTTKPFSYNGFEETMLTWRLDYVFVSDDITVKSSEILQTEFSDHLPILAKIDVP